MVGPRRPQFVLFGSSIVQISFKARGWGSILADLYDRKADIILRGYSGWNSRMAVEVLNQIFPQDAAVHPSLVITYFGGNDAMRPHPSGVGPHVPLAEYVGNMKKIALHLRSLGEKLRMIFLTCPPVHEEMVVGYYGNMFDKQERSNEACRVYAEALVALCKEMDIEVINLWTAFQHRDDWGPAYLSDGIHLSDGGSRVVAKEILKVLRDAEWEPSLYWLSMAAEFSDNSPYYSVASDGETTVNVSDTIAEWKMEWMERSEVETFGLKVFSFSSILNEEDDADDK
ncbi:GDSL esterase/lipase CPRD49-like [Salvia miltiorrhiza]|uniref:GDSL esterase/lipase CPRD49-like n=1 Tax=Salvia miltiorrhiza TaxID=226208 RepID=UPI0025AC50C9|nr:GDSL esterase/lipase CPRD49-like [Salvia miltiorrhiza]